MMQAPNEQAITSADLLTLEGGPNHWLVEQRLPRGGVSVLAGAPGVGKRSLARDLSLCVARGRPWLGFPTTAGRVLYARLSEFAKLRALFMQGGLAPSDDVWFADAERPGSRLRRVAEQALSLRPTLIVVDGLEQLRQEEAYYRRSSDGLLIDRVLDLGSEIGAHLLVVHDIVDSLAGDLASFLSGTRRPLDAILMLSSRDGKRVLRTVQRQGLDLLDGIELVGPSWENDEAFNDLEAQILAYLRRCGRLAERDEIARNVSWTEVSETRAAVRALHRRGVLIRTGRGTEADPYRYTGFDRADDPTRPVWLRKVRPWARLGRGCAISRAMPTPAPSAA